MRARQDRPAVESLIFTLKCCHRFGRLSRRDIEAVGAESWRDVLAYNCFRSERIWLPQKEAAQRRLSIHHPTCVPEHSAVQPTLSCDWALFRV